MVYILNLKLSLQVNIRFHDLFFYVKNAHAAVIPGVKEYVKEFTASRSIGSDGYLVSKGLIPLSDSERTKFEKDGKTLAKFDVKVLGK